MSLPTSRHAYRDCKDLFDAALKDDQGARVKVESYDAAIHFRMRMQQFRKLDRQDSMLIYEKTDPNWNISMYDPLVVKIKNIQGDMYVQVEHVGLGMGPIEGLSAIDEVEVIVADVDETKVDFHEIDDIVNKIEPMRRRV